MTFAGNHFRSPAGADFDQLADATTARGRGSVGDSALDVEAVAGHWSHALRPRLENTVHAQWVHDLESERPRAPLPQEPAISANGEAPEVEIAPNGFTFGTSASLDRTAYPDEHRLQAADTLQWAVGRNVLSLGADWSRVEDRVDSLRNENGTFLYDSGAMGGRAGGLVDWITDATFNVHAYPNGGCPSITAAVHDFCFRTYTQSFGTAAQQFATHEFAGFAEGTFFARPDLRVALGARYEYTLLPLPQFPNTGLDASLRGLALPAPLTGLTSAFPEDRNNVGPRVGLAWAPHAGRWFTAKGGYGLFFGRLPGTTVRAALANNGLASGIEQVRITPTTETLCPQVANQGFGYPCAFTGGPPSAVAQTSTVMLFSGHFRLPAVQRASLTVERGFGKRLAVEMGYQGAWATQLPSSVDVNIAPATSVIHFALQGGESMPGLAKGRDFTVPLYAARRLANVGPVTAITSQANATYHAGSVTARMAAWHGVEARASVTFSRAIDDNPQSGTDPLVNGSFDPFVIGYDKGLSDLHAPLRFSGSVVARTEWRRGPQWVREGLTGWRAAALATAASGAPYSYQIFGGTRLTGGHTSINDSGGATFLPTVGRNTLRLPARGNLDLRLERGAAVHGVKVSGFAEAFNLLNERNLSRVETRAFLLGTPANGATPLIFQDAAAVASEGVNTPAFGTPTSSSSGVSRERLVALGVRVEF